MPLKGSVRKRAARRAWGIRAYVGGNGHGKSLAMVHDTLPSLAAGRRVLSTVRLLDWQNPRPCEDDSCLWPEHPDHGAAHPLWVPFTEWGQFLAFRDGDVLLDEVAGVASSRESSSLPFQVARDLQQLRRRNVVLSWTAPAWTRADRIIRECTQLVVECRGRMSRTVTDSDLQLAWPDRRLFRWTGFDAVAFDAWTQGTKDRAEVLNGEWFWRSGTTEAERAYSTRDHVASLGWAGAAGICLGCGGRRAVPRCSCPGHGADSSGAGKPSAAGGPATGAAGHSRGGLAVLRSD